MPKTYRHIKYIPHLYVLRLVVVAPFALAWYISNFVAEKLEKFSDTLDAALPKAYTEEMVEWDQLSPREQKGYKEIARARGVILSQVQSAS